MGGGRPTTSKWESDDESEPEALPSKVLPASPPAAAAELEEGEAEPALLKARVTDPNPSTATQPRKHFTSGQVLKRKQDEPPSPSPPPKRLADSIQGEARDLEGLRAQGLTYEGPPVFKSSPSVSDSDGGGGGTPPGGPSAPESGGSPPRGGKWDVEMEDDEEAAGAPTSGDEAPMQGCARPPPPEEDVAAEQDDLNALNQRERADLQAEAGESSPSDAGGPEGEGGGSQASGAAQPGMHDMLRSCRHCADVFDIGGVINEGTYGVVYRATEKGTGRKVALKRIKLDSDAKGQGFPITSVREINIMLGLNHANIVNVEEVVVGDTLDKIYMVMEYVDHDLKAFMERFKRPFSLPEIKCIVGQMLAGVAYLHHNWVLHRDLKGANILYSELGRIKICDFGMARQYASPLDDMSPEVVTRWYRAPELLLGASRYSTGVDVWSVGCIMGELISGDPMFKGRSEMSQLPTIIDVLGSIGPHNWVDYELLPYIKGDKVNLPQGKASRLRSVIPSKKSVAGQTGAYKAYLTDVGFDLLERMLSCDPGARISATAALEHPWFQEAPAACPPQLMPAMGTTGAKAAKEPPAHRPSAPGAGGFKLRF